MQTHQNQTLTQFLLEQQQRLPLDTALAMLIEDIASSCIEIARHVRDRDVKGFSGAAHSENSQGETQKQLDIISDELLLTTLMSCSSVAAAISEERPDITVNPKRSGKSQFLVAYDPLDGSSNIDINISVGTIFSILPAPENNSDPIIGDFLQNGRQQCCAGFCVYGPSTSLVLTTGQGVHGFTLDNESGEFLMTHQHFEIPPVTAEFAINTSNQRFWYPPTQHYIAACLAGVDGDRTKNFNMRWVASMVAEVYRILIRGGVFLYPEDSRKGLDSGKLRLLYEANPMSFIVEQAGGLSTTGRDLILDLQAQSIHQRVPVILGSKQEVQHIERYYRNK